MGCEPVPLPDDQIDGIGQLLAEALVVQRIGFCESGSASEFVADL